VLPEPSLCQKQLTKTRSPRLLDRLVRKGPAQDTKCNAGDATRTSRYWKGNRARIVEKRTNSMKIRTIDIPNANVSSGAKTPTHEH
jgi:hypothetical protein